MGVTRRSALLAPLLLASPSVRPPAPPVRPPPPPASIDIPLRPCGVGALCALVDLGRGVVVKAVVDTGGPHLTVPAGDGCSERDGCADALSAASRTPVPARFGVGEEGVMRWRQADQFVVAGGANLALGGVVVGVPDLLLRRASGGFFLGLIRKSDDAAHPPLLAQLALPATADTGPPRLELASDPDAGSGGSPVAAFRIDAPRRVLTLSSAPLIPRTADAIPLLDLRRYGTTVCHYAARVSALEIDGVRLPLAKLSRPVVCLLDTGLSCAVVSSELIVDATRALRGQPGASAFERPPDEWSSLALTLRSERRRAVVLRAGGDLGPFFCAAVSEEAMYDSAGGAAREIGPHFVAVGATFLGSGVLTIDADAGRATFADGEASGATGAAASAWYAR